MQNPIQIRPLPGSSSEMYRKGDVVDVQWTGRDADRGKLYRGIVPNVPRLGSTRSGTIDFQYWATRRSRGEKDFAVPVVRQRDRDDEEEDGRYNDALP